MPEPSNLSALPGIISGGKPEPANPVFQAFDALPAMIAYACPSLRYAYANLAYCNWWGVSRAEITGKLIQEILGPEAWGNSEPILRAALNGEVKEQAFSVECQGRSRQLQGAYVPDMDTVGRVKGVFVHLTDVTAVVSERRLKSDHEELSRAFRMKDEFFQLASHELKTPLTSMRLQNQLLSRLLPQGEGAQVCVKEVRTLIERNQKQIDRLTKIVEEMLDISRAQVGQLVLSTAQVDLSQLAAEVAARLEAQFSESQMPLELRLEAGISACIDAPRIERVILNLLTNGLKYGAGKPVCLALARKGDFAEIQVVDQGPGIAPEDQERIFRRFERVASDPGITGLGLGLYIVRKIVERHGGRISVASELGRGSCFTVSLPL